MKKRAKILKFSPNIFLKALNKLSYDLYDKGEEFSCYCIKSEKDWSCWDARKFYEGLFNINVYGNNMFDGDANWMNDLTLVKAQEVRFMCLYLAYLVAKDVESGKIALDF